MKISFNANKLILIIGITIYLIPTLSGIYGIHKGQLIYTLIWGVLMLSLLPFYKKIKLTNELLSFFILSFIVSIYYCFVIIVNSNGNISIRDLFEPFRPFLYLLAVITPIFIIGDGDIDIIHILRKLRLLTIVIGIFDLLKFFPAFKAIAVLYCPASYGSLNYYRFSGTFGYAYNYGFWLLFLLLFTFFEMKYLYSKRIFHFLILLIYCFLTGSRSVLLSLFFISFLVFLFEIKGTKRKVKFLFTTIILSIGFYSILKYSNIDFFTNTVEYIERLFLAVAGQTEDGSMTTRLGQLSEAFQNFSNNLLIGNGPQKENSKTIEILFAHYLGNWGLVGFSLYIFTLLIFYFSARKVTRTVNNQDYIVFSKTNLYWILVIPVIGLSTPITDQVRIFNLFYLIQGLLLAISAKSYLPKKTINLIPGNTNNTHHATN